MDKIQHAYGWCDEEVFNLTLRRAVQMKESIEQREEIRAWEKLKIAEWQTQNLGLMIANTLETEEGRKVMSDMALSMSLTGAKPKDKGLKTPKTYKLKTGEIIPASEINQYTYDEIDHTEEEAARMAAIRKKNAGKNFNSMFQPK